jgi:hypothetical protein
MSKSLDPTIHTATVSKSKNTSPTTYLDMHTTALPPPPALAGTAAGSINTGEKEKMPHHCMDGWKL